MQIKRLCSEIKGCPFNGTERTSSECPAYRDQLSCWEFDWVAFYHAMPESPEREEWRDTMMRRCGECEIRAMQPAAVEEFLQGLREA